MDVSLENLGAGAVLEKFDDEMKKVIANILDPNTEADAARGLTVQVKLKPRKGEREVCSMEIIVSSKLAPTKSLISQLAVGINQHGEVAAIEYVPQQGNLFPEEEKPKIRRMSAVNE